MRDVSENCPGGAVSSGRSESLGGAVSTDSFGYCGVDICLGGFEEGRCWK